MHPCGSQQCAESWLWYLVQKPSIWPRGVNRASGSETARAVRQVLIGCHTLNSGWETAGLPGPSDTQIWKKGWLIIGGKVTRRVSKAAFSYQSRFVNRNIANTFYHTGSPPTRGMELERAKIKSVLTPRTQSPETWRWGWWCWWRFLRSSRRSSLRICKRYDTNRELVLHERTPPLHTHTQTNTPHLLPVFQ